MADILSHKRPQNPYQHRTALRNPADFFGRVDFLSNVFSLLFDKQNVSITGLRRIGKSSVLACMGQSAFQSRFTHHDLSRHLFTFVDLEEHQQHTVEEFLSFVSTRLLRACQGKLTLQRSAVTRVEEFRDLLEEIKDQQFHPVLLLDELDCITSNSRFTPDFFIFLRAQADHGMISYVTASLISLEKLSYPGLVSSPFFNIFSFRSLEALTRSEALELILEPSRAAGCPFSSTEAEWVLELAGRHPFFIQCVCYCLFEEKLRGDNLPDYALVEMQASAQLRPHFDQTWKHLAAEDQEKLKGEARRQTSGPRELSTLSESSLFRSFLRESFGFRQEALEISEKHLEKILSQLDNLAFLGESRLSYLNSVCAHCSLRTTLYERGAIVRKLLLYLVESLKIAYPQGKESGGRLYDILNHSYLSSKLNNGQVAARLGISERQFYRDKKHATQVLLQLLFDLESSPDKWNVF